MLTQDYFYGKSDRMIEIYQEFEDWILQDIAGRLLISGEVSGTADREMWKLNQMGLHQTAIMKKLSVLTGKSQRELKELFKDCVVASQTDDLNTLRNLGQSTSTPLDNKLIRSIMEAKLRVANGDLDNLTRTSLQQSSVDFMNMLNEVDFRVSSGMQSYSAAVCEVLDRYGQSGVMINYPSGACRSIESVVRMCVVTSMNQTSAQITNQYIVEGGIEYVLVSAHAGARHSKKNPDGISSHDSWQGKVYKINGSGEGYLNLAEATGYYIDPVTGEGKVIDPLGLHGYNCRHSHKPWDKSLRNPYEDEAGNPKIDIHESQELYEKQQKQRELERAIRRTKRELNMKQVEIDKVVETDVKRILEQDYDRLAYKLRRQNKRYKEFCASNDLQTQADRLKTAGFKRAQAAKANGRATSYANRGKKISKMPRDGGKAGLNDIKTNDIISVEDTKNFAEIKQYMKQKYGIGVVDSIKNLDFQSIREGIQGIEYIMQEFPQAQSSFKRIGISKSGLMSAGYSGDINFNPYYYQTRSSALLHHGIVKGTTQSDLHPKGNNCFGSGAHESGHILEKALIDKANGGETLLGKLSWADETYAKAVVNDACREAKKLPECKGMRNAQLKRNISAYAAEKSYWSDSECLAEAVCDYALNGKDAAPLSRKIWKILKKELG